MRGRTLSTYVTWAAAAGVTVGTSAMILVLSAFNGLEELVLETYQNVHPEVTLVHREGSRFDLTSEHIAALESDSGLTWIPVQSQKALLRSAQREVLVTVEGMPQPLWTAHPWMDSLTSALMPQGYPGVTYLGYGVAGQLGYLELSGRESLELLWPRSDMGASFDLSSAFHREILSPEAIFFVHPQIDQQHIVVDLTTLQGWTHDERIDAIHCWGRTKEEVLALVGSHGEALMGQTPEDREAALFRVMRSEGMITTAILAFIVLLASLGLYSATVLLGMEKVQQRAILRAMGMSEAQVRRSFWWSAMWVSAVGGLGGWILGTLLVWGQSTFGWVKLGSGYVVESYPMAFHAGQSLVVFAFVLFVGSLLGWGATARLQSPLSGLRGQS